MENHHVECVNQLWMAMFNSYVALPEGNYFGGKAQVPEESGIPVESSHFGTT